MYLPNVLLAFCILEFVRADMIVPGSCLSLMLGSKFAPVSLYLMTGLCCCQPLSGVTTLEKSAFLIAMIRSSSRVDAYFRISVRCALASSAFPSSMALFKPSLWAFIFLAIGCMPLPDSCSQRSVNKGRSSININVVLFKTIFKGHL